jgi:hypothetical protein
MGVAVGMTKGSCKSDITATGIKNTQAIEFLAVLDLFEFCTP